MNSSAVHPTLFLVEDVRGHQEDLFSVRAQLSNGGVLSSEGRKNIILKYVDGENIDFG